MMTSRLLILFFLVAACNSPAASPSRTSAVTSTPTFAAATTSPVGSSTATPRELAEALAKAFASKDADAVGRLLAPQTSIGVTAVVEPVQAGDPDRGNCCVLNPAVASIVNELRGKFADGSLDVTVDPRVQPTPANTAAPFFVSSDWREADRTTKIDLYLRDMGSGWFWVGALHHYPKSASTGVCIVHYRPPWVPTGTTTHGC